MPYCAGLIPYRYYSNWFAYGCNNELSNLTGYCNDLFNNMTNVIGVNFDPDNLYVRMYVSRVLTHSIGTLT